MANSKKQLQKKIDFDTLKNFDTFFRSAPTIMAVNRADDRTFVQVNDAFVNTLGYSREEIIGKTAAELNLFNDETQGQAVADMLASKRSIKDVEFDVRTKDGKVLNGVFSGEIITVEGVEYMMTVMIDVTERRKLEQELNTTFESAAVGIANVSSEGKYLKVNRCMCEITGYSKEELVGKDFRQITHSDDLAVDEDIMQNFISGEVNTCIMEKRYICKDESIVWAKLSISGARDKNDNLDYIIVVVQDISKQKTAEKEHTRIMAAVEQLTESVIITDPNGYIVYVNTAFSKITGYSCEEVIGRNTAFLESGMHEKESYYNIYGVIDRGETWKGRFVNLKKDGSTYVSETIISPVKDDDGKIVNLVAIEQDVTEKVAKEEQMQQSQKMESIGQLAGGVAHDFNNLLMAIMGYVDLCRDELEPEHPVVELLNEITSAAERSILITKQLLAFARKQNISPKIINLNKAISGMLKLLSRMIGEDVSLNWVPCDDPWMVRIDPGQVDQIMTNLFVNARDAIDGVGNIMIETYKIEVNSDFAYDDAAGVARGQYMVIAFSDDGCGMDKKTQSNVFEPFFTTKDVGKGTGLGLATIYGIARQNDGYVNVYSEPGQGTTFRIYFPRFQTENADSSHNFVVDAPDEIQGGSETILLVEDEKNIRAIASLILEKLGYKILLADKPDAAIKISNEYAEEIDLLFADVVLPDQNGPDLAKELANTRPNMKQLFMSGYTANVILQKNIVKEQVNFLPKPFSRETLATKIREILDNP